jgi:hypothetical protein
MMTRLIWMAMASPPMMYVASIERRVTGAGGIVIDLSF